MQLKKIYFLMKKEIFLKNKILKNKKLDDSPPIINDTHYHLGTGRGTRKKRTGSFYITPTLRIYRKVGGIK